MCYAVFCVCIFVASVQQGADINSKPQKSHSEYEYGIFLNALTLCEIWNFVNPQARHTLHTQPSWRGLSGATQRGIQRCKYTVLRAQSCMFDICSHNRRLQSVARIGLQHGQLNILHVPICAQAKSTLSIIHLGSSTGMQAARKQSNDEESRDPKVHKKATIRHKHGNLASRKTTIFETTAQFSMAMPAQLQMADNLGENMKSHEKTSSWKRSDLG